MKPPCSPRLVSLGIQPRDRFGSLSMPLCENGGQYNLAHNYYPQTGPLIVIKRTSAEFQMPYLVFSGRTLRLPFGPRRLPSNLSTLILARNL
jgi:hypothetical protein